MIFIGLSRSIWGKFSLKMSENFPGISIPIREAGIFAFGENTKILVFLEYVSVLSTKSAPKGALLGLFGQNRGS